MAQSKPRHQRRDTFWSLACDLDLLFPNGYDSLSSIIQGITLRDRRIQELTGKNGTLQKVGLSSVKHLEV